MSELMTLAKQVIDMTIAAGAKEAAVTIDLNTETECVVRAGKVESLLESAPQELKLQVYADGRYALHTTTDFRPASLQRFSKQAVELTKLLEADPFRTLPDPKWYQNRSAADLAMFDPAQAKKQVAQRKAAALAIEQGAKEVAGKDLVSANCSIYDSSTENVRVTSNGFADRFVRTYFDQNAAVTLRDGERRPEDGWGITVAKEATFNDYASIGRTAAKRALGRLGAKKIEGGAMPILVEARAVGRLMSGFTAALSGQALQQKRSFLDGKRGQKVMSEKFTLRDEPLLPGGTQTRTYDGDGISAKTISLVKAGVLENYYIDWYYGQKLKLDPTTGGMSNLVVEPGKETREALEASIKKGIVITNFIGGNSNALTGDFSYGVVGYAVENGKRTHAVAELNLTGNHKDFWTKIAALGSDPWIWGANRSPSLLFDGAAISGA